MLGFRAIFLEKSDYPWSSRLKVPADLFLLSFMLGKSFLHGKSEQKLAHLSRELLQLPFSTLPCVVLCINLQLQGTIRRAVSMPQIKSAWVRHLFFVYSIQHEYLSECLLRCHIFGESMQPILFYSLRFFIQVWSDRPSFSTSILKYYIKDKLIFQINSFKNNEKLSLWFLIVNLV